MSEQTYENKSLVFGCILDPEYFSASGITRFPELFLNTKKYKALSDGFRTAYHVASDGGVIDFVDMERMDAGKLTERYYFPEWAAPMARVSLRGQMRNYTYATGRHLSFRSRSFASNLSLRSMALLESQSRRETSARSNARTESPFANPGQCRGSIYRASLDISFRRSGALFIILHNRKDLKKIVREGDAINDYSRNSADKDFDEVVRAHKMQSLPRAVAVELASLDGAVVLANSGAVLAYGAVLEPRKKGKLRGTEGSRTKAAIGASNYGLAIKISSDGDITVYFDGKEFFKI